MSPKNRQSGSASSQQRSVGGDASDDNCAFDQVVDLTGVRTEVVETIKVGEILNVRLRGDSPTQSVVCVVQPEGPVVGSIVGIPGLARLVRCIDTLNSYEALVVLRDRARCQVRISNASPSRG
jgi:hypothetical protein